MATLTVEKLHDGERTNAPIMHELEGFLDATRRRAFDLFSQRGAGFGADLDDWLRAEREVAWSPQSELAEDEQEIRIQMAVPGLDPRQIHITAFPDAIVVKGEASHKHESHHESVQFCEFSDKSLLRNFVLPSRIDVDRVNATVDLGLLRIVAPKAKKDKGRQVPVTRS